MVRLWWRELRFRRLRSLTMFLGVWLAVTGFVILTASVRTQQAQLTGFVNANSRAAYDILVRPVGSQLTRERQSGLVRDNFLAGQYGGITMSQWKTITGVAGVQTAAPVAMLGYVPVTGSVQVDVTKSVRPGLATQIVKVADTWVTDRGLTRIADPGSTFVYVTTSPVVWPHLVTGTGPLSGSPSVEYEYQGHRIAVNDQACPDADSLPSPAVAQPNGTFAVVCTELDGTLDTDAATSTDRSSAASRSTVLVAQRNADGTFTYARPGGQPTTSPKLTVPTYWTLSLMTAAVDPTAENQLVGLNRATTAGAPLSDSQVPVAAPLKSGQLNTGQTLAVGVPVLLSNSSGLDEQLATRSAAVVGALPPLSNLSPDQMIAKLNSSPVLWNSSSVTAAESMYQATIASTADLDPRYAIGDPSALLGSGITLNPHIKSGPVSYSESPGADLDVREYGPEDGTSLWNLQNYGTVSPIPGFALDDGFRPLSQTGNIANVSDVVTGVPVGVFDPGKIDQFSSLSAVAMETFAASSDTGGDARSSKLLDGKSLGANSNPGSYIAPAPELLTTMAAVPYILDRSDPQYRAPISEIQVRVADVTGINSASEGRLAAVAEEIRKATGLQVDIVAASSPTAVSVALPAGAYGRPALVLSELWSKKGVDVALVSAIDNKSVLLFALVLVICILFVGNAAAAAVRTRRSELAALSCIGWSGRRLAAIVLGEVLAVAFAAGLVGVALAIPLGLLAGVHVGLLRALLAIPIALAVAALAAAPAAVRAGRAHPGSGLRPSVLAVAPMRRVRSVRVLSWQQTTRTLGRTFAAVGALALGICAMGLLVGIDTAFHATATDSLLADAVGVRVRAADDWAAALALVLSVTTAADVVYLGVKERERELATLRATGWADGDVRTLVLWESVLIAALAGLLGGALAALATLAFVHTLPALVYVALAVLFLGSVALTAAAALIPARLSNRSSIAALLATE